MKVLISIYLSIFILSLTTSVMLGCDRLGNIIEFDFYLRERTYGDERNKLEDDVFYYQPMNKQLRVTGNYIQDNSDLYSEMYKMDSEFVAIRFSKENENEYVIVIIDLGKFISSHYYIKFMRNEEYCSAELENIFGRFIIDKGDYIEKVFGNELKFPSEEVNEVEEEGEDEDIYNIDDEIEEFSRRANHNDEEDEDEDDDKEDEEESNYIEYFEKHIHDKKGKSVLQKGDK
jgi:hypothetical protein